MAHALEHSLRLVSLLVVFLSGLTYHGTLAYNRLKSSNGWYLSLPSMFLNSRSAIRQQYGDHLWRIIDNREKAKVERDCASAIFSLTFWGNVCIASMLRNFAFGIPRWMSVPQDWIIVLFSAACIVWRLNPQTFLRYDRLPYTFSFSMLLISLFVLTSNSPTRVMVAVDYCFIYRVTICVSWSIGHSLDKFWLVVFWNIVAAVCAIYAYSSTLSDKNNRANEMYDEVTPFGYAVSQILSASFIIIMTHKISKVQRADAVKSLKHESLLGKKSAMNSLLELMCDVVIELDSELQLVEESPRLAAMLSPGSKSLVKDSRLEKFMPFDEDKDKYRKGLQSIESEGSGHNAGALHVKMRDSMSNLISVDLFFVQCLYEDQTHYLLGLRESADIPMASMKTKSPSLSKTATSCGIDINRPNDSKLNTDGATLAPVQIGATDCCDSDSCATSDIPSVRTLDCPSAEMSGRLLREDLRATADVGFTLSLIAAMSRWNIKVHKTACCPVHAAVKTLNTYTRILNRYPCAPEFGPKGHLQCRRCGLVHGCDWQGRSEQNTKCHACDSQLSTPSTGALAPSVGSYRL